MPNTHTRRESLNALDACRAANLWKECNEQCFRTIYELPRAMQMGFAKFALQSYVQDLQSRKPEITWPSRSLVDPADWIATYGRTIPGEPMDSHPADAVFLNAVDGLFFGVACPDSQPGLVTTGFVYSAVNAIEAKAIDAWATADPEAAHLWQSISSGIEGAALEEALQRFAGRSYQEMPSTAVFRDREWHSLIDWLRQESIDTYPPVENIEEMERALQEWKDREMLLPSG